MKKISFTFQIEPADHNATGDTAFRKIFERGLESAKHSVRAVSLFEFRYGCLGSSVAEAMSMLKAAGRENSSDAVAMIGEAVECIKGAQVQLQLQHDNDNAVLKDHLEGIKYESTGDVQYQQSVAELKAYCDNFRKRAMSIMKAYDAVADALLANPVWLDTYSTIIGLGDKFIQDVFDEYEIAGNVVAAVKDSSEVDDLIIKWRARLDEVNAIIKAEEERRRKEEEERLERERKAEEERLRKEAEERARREAEEAAERIRREAEEAAERARQEAAARIAREQKEAEEAEAYEKLLVTLNDEIKALEAKKASIQAQYDELAATIGSKLSDQEAEINLLNNIKQSQKELEEEVNAMTEDRTEKMAKYVKLGVFAGAEKKNLKLEIDKIDIEIAGKKGKLASYNVEIESMERRVNGKDNGARLKLRGLQEDLNNIDSQVDAIRKRMVDEKPAHMQ